MTDITVIILVGREELHIARCLERLAPLEARQIVVVESQKGDATHALAEAAARKLGWKVVSGQSLVVSGETRLALVWHDWEGNQARQFNWALDNLPIEGSWVLRLDADEYLTDDSIKWLRTNLLSELENSTANGCMLELRRKFFGGEIRHATNGIRQVRLFRKGKARYAEILMDERIDVDGPVIDIPCAFYDDNLMTLPEWKVKHHGYAKREAEQALEGLKTGKWTDPRKAKYYRLPPYLRAFLYFGVRYFLKGGILDGRAGWMWNFWQGLWYRLLVDRVIGQLKASC